MQHIADCPDLLLLPLRRKNIPIEKSSSGGELPLVLSGLGQGARLRLILAHLRTHRDSEAVPGVDGGQGKPSAISSCSLKCACARSKTESGT